MNLTQELPGFSEHVPSASPHSMMWGGQAVSAKSCPLTTVRVEIYTVSSLFLLGLRFIYLTIFPLGPVSCPAHLVLSQGRAEVAESSDRSVCGLEPCHQEPLSLDLCSNCQYKRRDMTGEKSQVLKSPSIHSGVLRTIRC